MKKILVPALVLAVTVSGGVLAPTSSALAQYRDWHRHGPPPPPRRHHHDDGAVIAGGLAAGVLGGLIGGAIATGGPRYIEPPPPRCWFEDRRVPNAYDGGWHMESIRICQ